MADELTNHNSKLNTGKEIEVNNNNLNKERENTRIITIASGKGGVGKTNIAVNLGLSLQKAGMNTLLIDADFGMANVDVLLGITPKYNLSHILNGKCLFDEAIVDVARNLHILPGNSGVDTLMNMSSVAIRRLLETSDYIEEHYDLVLIDVGAGINRDVINFIKASDEVVIILTPEPTSIMDAYGLIKVLNNNDYRKKINLFINQVSSKQEGKKVNRKITNAIKKYLSINTNTIGYIPQDNKVKKAVRKQSPFTILYPNCSASKAIEDAAHTILKRKKEKKSRGMKAFIYRLSTIFNN